MKKYFIKTFGCQANEADSERIARLYQEKGFKPAPSLDKADVVIINTCSVRESAENRAYGLVNNLVKKFNHKPLAIRPKLIIAGCLLRHGVTTLRKKLPQVDDFLRMEDYRFNLTPVRKEEKTALVPIMEGCSHYCSYCVVPYARGQEKSRFFDEIVCEVEKLVKQGYQEITLLGQNVNSYGKDLRPRREFNQLLQRLHEIKGIERISFLTSNPWDLTNDIIQSIKLPKIDKYLHLPVQSGDDEILKKMNRPYTALQYIKLIEKIRREVPEIKIGTDIIVGFPGETQKAFQKTVDLCKKVGFNKAYIAKYSPRPGTLAYKLKDDVLSKEKKRRWRVLEELINQR